MKTLEPEKPSRKAPRRAAPRATPARTKARKTSPVRVLTNVLFRAFKARGKPARRAAAVPQKSER